MLKQIKINNNSFTHVTHERNPEDEWSADSTDTDHAISSFSVSNGNGYFDLVVDTCIVPKRKYILLYATYSTGDSFSHHGGQIDYIGLYDEDQADIVHATKCKLRDATGYSVTITAENGEPYSYGIPWHGYFERLEAIESIEIYESI